jgi:hypothetical protein
MATVRNAMENADERQRRKLAQQQALNNAAKQPGMVYKTIPGGKPAIPRPRMGNDVEPPVTGAVQPRLRPMPVQPPAMRPVQPPTKNFNRPVPLPGIITGPRPMPVQPPSMRPGIPVPPSPRPQPIAGIVPNPGNRRQVPPTPAPKPVQKPVAPPRRKPNMKRINYGGMR